MQPRLHARLSGLTKTRQASSHISRRVLVIALLLTMAAPGLLLAAWRSVEAARHSNGSGKSSNASAATLPMMFVDDNQPNVGPGIVQTGSNAPKTHASSTKAGSVLFFHRFTSDSSGLNTLLTISNTNPRDSINVRMFYVSNCQVSSIYVPLAANQSRSLLMSAEQLGKHGYAIAVATDSRGVPTQFNWLIGSAVIRDSLGHQAHYNAFSVARRKGGPVSALDGATTADLLFNGAEYDQLPRNVAIDNLQPQTGASAVFTDFVAYTPLSNLGAPQPLNAQINGVAYENNGRPYLSSVDNGCGLLARVTDIFPDLNNVIVDGKPGWANFAAIDKGTNQALPILGLSLTDRASVPLHNARTMQVLQWMSSYKITVPVNPPDSPAPNAPTSDLAEPTGTATGISEVKPGSILLYSNFVSGQFGSSKIHLTNTHKVEKTRVRVFFVGLNPVGDPAVAPPAFEQLVTLFPTQSFTLNAQDIAPNQRGWVIAVAIDNNALPRKFNNLIGSVDVMEATGQAATFNALGIEKYTDGSVPRNDDVLTSDILFNDLDYDRLPATIGVNAIPPQNEVTTLFGFRRPNDNLTTTPNTRGSASLTVYDDLLRIVTATMGPIQTNLDSVRSGIPLAPVTKNITPGHRGWMKLQSNSPIFAWFNNLASVPLGDSFNGIWNGGVSGGGNAHILTTVPSHLLKTLSTNPDNTPPTAVAESIGVYVEQRRQDGTVIRLDGRNSYDDNPEATLRQAWYDNDRLVSTSKVSDLKLARGLHIIKLIVTDDNGIPSAPEEQLVEVRDTTPPVISGIPSAITKTVNSGSPGAFILFDIPRAWDAVDGSVHVLTSKNPNTVFPIGKTIVTFTARDNSGNTATATLTVTVNRGTGTFPQQGGVVGDLAPQMLNIFDQYVPPGTTRNLTLEATDENGDPVTFSVLGAPSWAQIVDVNPIARKATLRISPSANEVTGATNVRVIANDGRGFAIQTVAFRILPDEFPNDDTGSGVGPGGGGGGGDTGGGGGGGGGTTNSPPTARSAPLPPTAQATSKLGAEVTLDGSASSDPDPDDRLTYEWRDGETVIAQGALVAVQMKPGIHSITLKVTDTKGAISTTDPQVIEVLPRPLTISLVSPSTQVRAISRDLTITGTGFNEGSKVSIACNTLCSGGSQITITNYKLIEEDTIIITIRSDKAPMGWRDLTVTNPNGNSVTMRRAIGIIN